MRHFKAGAASHSQPSPRGPLAVLSRFDSLPIEAGSSRSTVMGASLPIHFLSTGPFSQHFLPAGPSHLLPMKGSTPAAKRTEFGQVTECYRFTHFPVFAWGGFACPECAFQRFRSVFFPAPPGGSPGGIGQMPASEALGRKSFLATGMLHSRQQESHHEARTAG